MISHQCFMKLSYHLHFGGMHSMHKYTSGISFLHPLSRARLPMRLGSSANQMYLIFAFGDALHMSSFRKTSAVLCNLTWRNVFSWAILVGTKVGCSTIPTHRSISSQNELNLMNVFSLGCPSTRHHHQLSSHHLNLLHFRLQQFLTLCSIWRGIVMMKMTAQLRLFHLFQFKNLLCLHHLLTYNLLSFLLSLLFLLLLLVVQCVFLILQANDGRLSILLNLKLKHQSFGQMMKRMLLMANR